MKAFKFAAPLLLAVAFITPIQAAGTKAPAGEVVKLGKISPNGPFRLWTIINKVLPAYAAAKGGASLRAQVENMAPLAVSGKKPGHVLAQSVQFRDALDATARTMKLAKVRIYKDPLGRTVTPGVVFVNAGYSLDTLVEVYFTVLNKSDAQVGDLYDVPVAAGKSPSDVFALVELATRRLRLIQGS
ncbi:MAG: hypothetical protein QF521_08275 [Alphaproteobacteria bacterium]|jgi:hypothetical protein|nr:hypothetical protein [Alphaproteobacteria bacterium]